MEAHIFLCVLAYHLLAAIERTLLDAGLHTSWATVPEPIHRKLYQQLGTAAEIMRPPRSLAPAEEAPK